ncbi:MAG: DUF1292 domain-containing protein [Lachnospiraceae bacterium]|nr:DUF1292 domain-containing protein [Lachnospiraceae bacterium]
MSKNTDNSNDDLDQITITLEDDTELLCDVIAIFDCNGRDYICLLPVDDPDGDFIFYRYDENEDGECELDDIEDDDEFDAVTDTFEEMLDEAEFDDAWDDFEDDIPDDEGEE